MSRSDTVEFLTCCGRYLPGVLAIVLTVGVSFANHLFVAGIGLPMAVALAVPPVALIASVIVRTDYDSSGVQLLLVAGLSWGLFSLARIPLVDPAAGRLVGSPLALLDLGLVWLGSYAVVGGIVYRTEWPTFDTESERDRERSQPDVADD